MADTTMPVTTLLATGSLTTSSTGTVLDLRNYVPNDTYTQLELRITGMTSTGSTGNIQLQFCNQGTPITAGQYCANLLQVPGGGETGEMNGAAPPIMKTESGSGLSDGSGTLVLYGFCSSSSTVTPSIWSQLFAQATASNYYGTACGYTACAIPSPPVPFDGLNFIGNGVNFSFNWALYGINDTVSGTSCNYATTGALTPANTYYNGLNSNGVGATLTANSNGALTVDGNSVSAGQRILVWQEGTPANNGIYVVTDPGSGSAAYVLTRAPDFNSIIMPGATTYIQSGTAYAEANFQMTTAGTIAVGTTDIAFTQITGSGGGTVTTTGSPASGNLTKFSGSTSVTNGNLSGDVTTSGTLTTTVAKIQGETVDGTTGTGDVVFSESPALAGTPTAPNPASGNSSTQIATTEFVQNSLTGGAAGGGTIAYRSIGGLLISSIAGTHTTASFSISAGGCSNLTGTAYMSTSGLSWAASNGNAINGTDAPSSTLANSTTYHVFLCSGTSGTGSFVSASLTPTFPTGYNSNSRRIGSFTTNSSGAPNPYTSIEIYGGATRNYLTTQVLDQGAASVTTSARTLYTLGSIPTGIKMRPIGRWVAYDSTTSQFIVTSPDETDVAPSGSAPGTVPGFDSSFNNPMTVGCAMFNWDLTTNTSAQIGGRGGSTSQSFSATTRGWDDFRSS